MQRGINVCFVFYFQKFHFIIKLILFVSKVYFKVFDVDKDGYLNTQEMEHMIETFLSLNEKEVTMEKKKYCFNDAMNYVNDSSLGMAQEEYPIWALKSEIPKKFTDLLFQVYIS